MSSEKDNIEREYRDLTRNIPSSVDYSTKSKYDSLCSDLKREKMSLFDKYERGMKQILRDKEYDLNNIERKYNDKIKYLEKECSYNSSYKIKDLYKKIEEYKKIFKIR